MNILTITWLLVAVQLSNQGKVFLIARFYFHSVVILIPLIVKWKNLPVILGHILFSCMLKGCVRYILASLFLRQKSALVRPGKMFFISLQKLFSLSRKSKFRISDIQISWRRQMPKHKTWNTFYWITWEVNTD